jgi:hypothetical protein
MGSRVGSPELGSSNEILLPDYLGAFTIPLRKGAPMKVLVVFHSPLISIRMRKSFAQRQMRHRVKSHFQNE